MKISPEVAKKVKRLMAEPKSLLTDLLGVEFLELTPSRVVASLEITDKVKQPFGIMHGGTSLVLAETVASIGGWLIVDEKKYAVVGLEINANHVRPVKEGKIIGVGRPLHIGRNHHVWEIKISKQTDQGEKLICVSRCTLAVVPHAK